MHDALSVTFSKHLSPLNLFNNLNSKATISKATGCSFRGMRWCGLWLVHLLLQSKQATISTCVHAGCGVKKQNKTKRTKKTFILIVYIYFLRSNFFCLTFKPSENNLCSESKCFSSTEIAVQGTLTSLYWKPEDKDQVHFTLSKENLVLSRPKSFSW